MGEEEAAVFRALHEIAVAVGGVLDPGHLARLVGEHSRRLLGADSVAVRLWDAATGGLRPIYRSDPAAEAQVATLAAGEGAAGQAFLRRAPVLVADYQTWEHRLPGLQLERARSMLAAPLLVAGRAIGVLSVGAARPHHWQEQHLRLLVLLAAQVAPSLEAARLYAVARADLARREALLRIAHRFAGDASTEELLDSLLREALALVGGDLGAVFRWDPRRGGLVPVRASGELAAQLPVIPAGLGVSGRAFSERAPVIIENYQRAPAALPALARAGLHAAVAVPLLHDGEAIGSLAIGSCDESWRYSADDVGALELLATMAAAELVGLERAQARAITVAARELAHRLNNDLTLALGAMELIGAEPGLAERQRELVGMAVSGLQSVAQVVARFQQVVRVVTQPTPVGPALDLEQSLAEAAAPALPEAEARSG